MSIWEMLNQLIIGPLEIIMEVIYGTAYNVTGNAGAAIIPLSLAVNFLLLPLYKRADVIQREERALEGNMEAVLVHIKHTFRGDERYMMQQAYYRTQHYKPVYVLKTAIPLLIQIPVFMAAYRFLASLELLKGIPFGVILDLSKPDRLLEVSGITVNLLPILMTLINILSSELYTKNLAVKDKLRLHGMALVFLVLLYNSPSGLVFYWTLNNIFSLVKNIVMTSPRRILARNIALSTLGAVIFLYGVFAFGLEPLARAAVFVVAVTFEMPTLAFYIKKANRSKTTERGIAIDKETVHIRKTFVLGCLFLTMLTGVLIPSAVIKSSPAEFVLASEFQNPSVYILYSALTAAGMFMLWLGLFYYLAGSRAKCVFSAAVWIISGVAVTNYMFFGTKLGMLSAQLQYDTPPVFSVRELIVNIAAVLFLGMALLIIWLKTAQISRVILPVLILTVSVMSAFNIAQINSAMPELKRIIGAEESEQSPITLDKNGKNVIVIMEDRFIGCLVPYLMQENSTLFEQFDGFTFYPNTLSYGPATNTGSPGVFGGYEYTPEEMNARSDELLVDKHNEALKVMPVIFQNADYRVTICDPTYAGYTWTPDLSVFDDYPDFTTFRAETGTIGEQSVFASEAQKKIWTRNFFCYGVMKISPLLLQMGLYQDGTYFNPGRYGDYLNSVQFNDGSSKAEGIRGDFITSYNVLCSLQGMTRFTDVGQNTFFMMSNSTTHNPMMLKEPEYEPAMAIDNTEYDTAHTDRFSLDGKTLRIDDAHEMSVYQSAMAAMMKFGDWFDYLRSEGVYDNTRIIIVADHGSDLELFDDAFMNDGQNIVGFNPTLLVKDFNSKGFSVDEQFMTNADTPTLATQELIENPVNPFTGNEITSDVKNREEQHIFYTSIWQTDVNNGTKFLPGTWYAFSGQDIFDSDNWKLIGDY